MIRDFKKFLPALTILLIILFQGCSHKAIVPRIDFITEEDNGRTILIEQGGSIEIDLPSEKTDENTWKVTGSIPNGLEMIGKPRKRIYTDSMGSAGVTTISFRTFSTGELPLKLELSDEKSKVVDTFEITLDIREGKEFFAEEEEDEDPGFISKTVSKVNPFSGERDELDDLDDLSEYKVGDEEEEPGIVSKTLNTLNPFSGDDEDEEETEAEDDEPGIIGKTLNTLNPFSSSDDEEEEAPEEEEEEEQEEAEEEDDDDKPGIFKKTLNALNPFSGDDDEEEDDNDDEKESEQSSDSDEEETHELPDVLILD